MTEEQTNGPEIEIIPAADAGVIAQISRSEFDMQVATAKAYPRNIEQVKQDMENLACLNKEVAESCFYAYKRGGKLIEGASVRLAEIAMSSWGNIRCQTRIVEEGKKYVTAQATAWDMQKNVLFQREVRRRITDRSGNRYSDDMITMTGNAAAMISYRNVVFVIVSRSIVDEVYAKARKVAFGDAKAIAYSRGVMLDTFHKLGVDTESLLASLEIQSTEEIGAVELSKLRGVFNAIREGSVKIEVAFPPVGDAPETQRGSRTASVMDKLRGKGGQTPKAAESVPTSPEPTSAPSAMPETVQTGPSEEQSPATAPRTELEPGAAAGSKKKERLVEIERRADDAGIAPEQIAEWKEGLNIHDGQLRSQSAKRLDNLDAMLLDWIADHAPKPEAMEESAPPEQEKSKSVVVHLAKEIVDSTLERISGLIGWDDEEEARKWMERVLGEGESMPDVYGMTAVQASRLERILDKRETDLAGDGE